MTKEPTAGHRQRLRERFMRGDPALQTDEALLELLLTFAIPQKDVQPLARDLIRRFGDLSAVSQAPAERLSEIPGIKGASSVLLKLAGAIGMERTLTLTAIYRADRRTFRKSRSHRFVLRMNPEQVVRRVPAHLGKILGLAPKTTR